jgi:hypothetical protein
MGWMKELSLRASDPYYRTENSLLGRLGYSRGHAECPVCGYSRALSAYGCQIASKSDPHFAPNRDPVAVRNRTLNGLRSGGRGSCG